MTECVGAMSDDPILKFSGAGYVYPSGDSAFDAVELAVPKGALVGLVGANGSGKSTIMCVAAGLYAPSSGSVRVESLTNPGDEKAIRSLCRLVMQDADLQILGGTVEEDMLLGSDRSESLLVRARDLAARFRLSEYWDRPVQSLSWGMKRKLCMASALLDDPAVLLLDEPFSGLDYPGIGEMRGLIKENKTRGLTQIVSSHDLECLVDMVDALALLDNGRLVASGPPDEVLPLVAAHGVRPPCSWFLGQGVAPWETGES